MDTGQLEPSGKQGLNEPTQPQSTLVAPEEQEGLIHIQPMKCKWFSNRYHLQVTASSATCYMEPVLPEALGENLGRSGSPMHIESNWITYEFNLFLIDTLKMCQLIRYFAYALGSPGSQTGL